MSSPTDSTDGNEQRSPGNPAPRFRKKPVVIEAVQFDGTWDSVNNWLTALGYDEDGDGSDGGPAMWLDNVSTPSYPQVEGEPRLVIQTLEGDMTATIGDWIIRGVKGEFYPCKPDIFEATYEQVSAPSISSSSSFGVEREQELSEQNQTALDVVLYDALMAALCPTTCGHRISSAGMVTTLDGKHTSHFTQGGPCQIHVSQAKFLAATLVPVAESFWASRLALQEDPAPKEDSPETWEYGAKSYLFGGAFWISPGVPESHADYRRRPPGPWEAISE